MESTSEVALKKCTKSSVTKSFVQEASTTSIQKLTSSSLVGEKTVSSILGPDGELIATPMGTGSIMMEAIPPLDSSLSLSSTVPTVNTTSLESEFSAMKLKDEHDNEIGEIVQEKQQQQSVQASLSVESTDCGSNISTIASQVSSSASTSSSMMKKSATTMVAQNAQECSSSSKTVAEKSEIVEELPENPTNDKQSVEEEVTVTLKKHVKLENSKSEETNNSDRKQIEETEPSSPIKEEVSEDDIEDEDDVNQKDENKKITEKITDAPDGGQTKTVTNVTIVKKITPEGTKNIVTTSSSTTEQHPAVVTITKSTPTSEEVKTEIIESNEEQKQKEINDKEDEEDEEEIEEEEEETEEEEKQEQEKQIKLQSDDSSQQQQSKNEIPEEPQKPICIKQETVVDAPSVIPQTNQHEESISTKQENLNNTIKDIISSIDSNITAEENIAVLKERELELLKKQQALAKEIEEQQLLAQKLANENQWKQQYNNNLINQNSSIPTKTFQPTTNVSKYTTFEEKQDNNIYSRKFETGESTNLSKKIDLHKIFTPATDAEEILPKNRKLYASSAFYSPTLHPTVEDQVELARRISHSLSDISNQQSRGQSMYVNRKKRSVKWVHEGCGQDECENVKSSNQEEYREEEKENSVRHHDKVPLKFVMNPSGQIRDINSLGESINTVTGLLSPDVSAEVVTALQAQKGKGAELFAKRRKVSEKWVVDESNVGAQSPPGFPDYHQYQQQPKPSTSPSILPAYTDAAKHRVQLNLHQEQLLEKYAKPGLRVVQTPWEAALNSGSASAAFYEEQKLSPYAASTLTPSPTPQVFDASRGGVLLQGGATIPDIYNKTYSTDDCQRYLTHSVPQQQVQHYTGTNSQRELAYKPSIPQGWKAPIASLPKGSVEHKQIKTDFKSSTYSAQQQQQQQQQQQEHIDTINRAVKSCEEFNTTDEIEIINLKLNDDVKNQISTASTKHLHSKESEFLNHFVKSPELRVSPVPIATLVIYDNSIQELHMKQLKEQSKQETKSPIVTGVAQIENAIEKEEKVNVRKQLQQYEDLHRQYTKRLEQEKILLKKREAAKLKGLQHSENTLVTNSHTDKTNRIEVQLESESKHNNEEYVKIPVKELITNFEQQCSQEEKVNTITTPVASAFSVPASKENAHSKHSLESSQTETEDFVETTSEDLYVPKEIPLQSYALPPGAAPTLPSSVPPFSTNTAYDIIQPRGHNLLNTSAYSIPESIPVSTKSYGGCNSFPVSKPYKQGFSSACGNSQAPKQQYLPPDSYQKVPQSISQNVPQFNYNPSPLPYDKLAKFENPPADDDRYINSPSAGGVHLNVRGSKVRNTSPAPFGGSYNIPYTSSSNSHSYGGASTRPNNQIINAPSYNTSARGWGCSGGASPAYQHSHMPANKLQVINDTSMPYTDF